jgi:hypothetical protein
MLCHATLAAVLMLSASQEQPKSVYFPANLYLVRARTDAIVEKNVPDLGKSEVGTFVITHVYVGPAQLKDKTFEGGTRPPPLGGNKIDSDRNIWYIKKDVDTIWWLYTDPKTNKLLPELRGEVIDTYRIRRFPYQDAERATTPDSNPFVTWGSYKEGLAWAEAVEGVYKAESDEARAGLLQRLAATEQSPVAGWAIAVLGKANQTGTGNFLKTLAVKDKLSLDSQVALDAVLCSIDAKNWPTCQMRQQLISRVAPELHKLRPFYKAGFSDLIRQLRKEATDPMTQKTLDALLERP